MWREELPYAKALLDGAVRDQLLKMLTWHIGIQTDFQQGAGKFGKALQHQLEPTLWSMVEQSYVDCDYTNNWNARLTMCDLFRQVALPIAGRYGFLYPHADAQRVSAHLRHIRALPKTATTIY